MLCNTFGVGKKIVVTKNLRTGVERSLTFHSIEWSELFIMYMCLLEKKGFNLGKKKKSKRKSGDLAERRRHLNQDVCVDSFLYPFSCSHWGLGE